MPTPAISLNRTYRLVTRSDFDGLVCAALLKELGLLHDILFVHPKDVQDGKRPSIAPMRRGCRSRTSSSRRAGSC